MHQGGGVPMMPSCWHLHRLLHWYQVVPRGIDSSCTVLRVFHTPIWLGVDLGVPEEVDEVLHLGGNLVPKLDGKVHIGGAKGADELILESLDG